MKRNWLGIAILSVGLSADALVLISLLWVILKQGGTGQAVGLAAFFMALVPYVMQRFSPRLNRLLAQEPGRVYSVVRSAGFLLSLVCAVLPEGLLPTYALYVISGVFALLTFLTTQSLETLVSFRVIEKAISPNLASRVLQTSIQIGAFLGGTISGFLIEWGGFRAVALALAAVYAFGAITIGTIENLRGTDESETAAKPSKGADLSRSADSPAVWGAFVMIALVLVQVWAFNVLVPYLSGIERGWTARDYGIIDAFAGAGAFVAALILGGRLGWISLLGFLGLAAADFWLAGTPSVLGAAAAAGLAGFFGNTVRVKQRELLFAATSSPEQATRWAGHLSMISFLTRALTPLALAGVIDRAGGTVCFQILALGLVTVGFTLQLMQVLAARFRPVRRRPIVAIVDSYSSGALLAPEWIARGYDCVHVMSSASLAPVFYTSLKEENFVDHVLFQGNLEETVEDLRKHRPRFVIAVREPGVELADALSERMGLLTNGTRMSGARRNKYLQIEALRARGLLCANQVVVTSVNEAMSAARELEIWPLVIKPLSSFSTDLVRLCENEDALDTAMRETLGRKGINGKYNDEILIQTFLKGTEYVVDTLSIEGRHRVTGVWKYEKASFEGASFVYRQVELIDPLSETARKLAAYAFEVIEALEIKHGPTHQEIMLTADGPALVECNARLCGAGMPALWQTCTGTSLPGLVTEALTDSKNFLRRPDPLCQLEKRGRIVCLSSQVDYCILNPAGVSAIQGLESFVQMIFTRKPVDVYPRTTNLISVVGQVHLAHADPAVVERDAAILRALESSGLYVEVSAPREYDRPFSVRRPQLVRVKAPVMSSDTPQQQPY